jgi:opacity protein-like surface antigen
LLCVFLLPLPALAQETPKVEIFGGYSLVRFSTGGFDIVDGTSDLGLRVLKGGSLPPFQVDGIFDGNSFTMKKGWITSFHGNVNSWFGIEGSFSGHYRSETVDGEMLKVRAHSFLFGPRITYRKHRVEPWVHVLVGGVHASGDVDGDSISENAFAAALGGGLDVKIHKNVAIRLAQVDYVMTRFFSETQNNFRFSTGIVFRLGVK